MYKFLIYAVISICTIIIIGCTQEISFEPPIIKNDTALVTLVEIGASNCDGCIRMKPILESLANKYKHQIVVVNLDVFKEYQKTVPYKIRVMPTQVFHNSEGIEFFRHEGFYAEDSIDIFLQTQGLKIIK